MKPVIVILGPTATGKTALSINLAKNFGGEIISADSMQVYNGMDIGTAKISSEERTQIPHHLVDIVNPTEEFSLSDYLEYAKKAAEDILNRGKIPFLVGGTGLYISSFTDNITLSPVKTNEEYRDFLNNFAKENGGYALKSFLRQIDSESFEKLKDNDIKRIARALEIYRETGKTVSEFNKMSKSASPYNFLKIGLNYEDRELLYEKINARVNKMFEDGLLREAENLNLEKCSKTARQAIGYRQLEEYFSGQATLIEAIEKIKQESRRYAKRQITWFKKDENISWHSIDKKSFKDISKSCAKDIENFLKICYN